MIFASLGEAIGQGAETGNLGGSAGTFTIDDSRGHRQQP